MADVCKIKTDSGTYDVYDERVDELLQNTLTIKAASYIGGTWSVTGGDENYSGSITGDTVEVGLRAHDATYTVTVTLGSDEWLTTVETGAYFEHYVIDGFEQVWRAKRGVHDQKTIQEARHNQGLELTLRDTMRDAGAVHHV